MEYQSKVILPCIAKLDAATILDVAQMVPLEKQAMLRDFLRGVKYGLDMAGVLSESSQASA